MTSTNMTSTNMTSTNMTSMTSTAMTASMLRKKWGGKKSKCQNKRKVFHVFLHLI
jgi:hypothetical protein